MDPTKNGVGGNGALAPDAARSTPQDGAAPLPSAYPPSAAPPARVHLPVVICPECMAAEPAAVLGDRSGAVVRLSDAHFRDARGFAFCRRCSAVWRDVHFVATRDPDALAPPPVFAADRLGAAARFNPYDARDVRAFKRLARAHAQAVGGDAKGIRRAADRIYDADVLCSILDLPPDVTQAVMFHVTHLSTRADIRSLCNLRMPNGAMRVVRAEALVVATVALVMERWHIQRTLALEQMLQAFRFTKGPAGITPAEYRAAYHACARWFAHHLWRDGAEDRDASLSKTDT